MACQETKTVLSVTVEADDVEVRSDWFDVARYQRCRVFIDPSRSVSTYDHLKLFSSPNAGDVDEVSYQFPSFAPGQLIELCDTHLRFGVAPATSNGPLTVTFIVVLG